MPKTFEETSPTVTRDDTIYAKKVILYNDDYNSFDHVEACLVEICKKTEDEAQEIALEAHFNGKAVCYEGSMEVCETVAERMSEEDLTVSVE